jgi:hypothetical protein
LQNRLEVEHERPDERTFRIRDLLGHVRRTRAELLHAASLVLAGWFSAGAPRPQHLAPWGSFDGWNGMVHAALVWAGYAPLDGNRRRLRDDADVDTHALQDALLELDRSLRQWGLSSASGRAALTVRDMLERIQRAPDATKSLRYALEALSATPPGQPLSAKRVGAAFGTFRNKIVNGLRLVRDAQRGEDGYRWTVERVSADGASAPPAALAAPAPPAPEPEPELWTPDDDPTL